MWAMDRMAWTALLLAAIFNTVLVTSAALCAVERPFHDWQIRGTDTD
jgi:hypothetical protein